MGVTGTALIYGIIGLVVAVAIALEEARMGAAQRWTLLVGALVFWPADQ